MKIYGDSKSGAVARFQAPGKALRRRRAPAGGARKRGAGGLHADAGEGGFDLGRYPAVQAWVARVEQALRIVD